MIYFAVIIIFALLFIILKLENMTELETQEFVNLNTKVDALGSAVTSALAAFAQSKADLAALQAQVGQSSDADIIAGLKDAEAKLDTSLAAIQTALAPTTPTA